LYPLVIHLTFSWMEPVINRWNHWYQGLKLLRLQFFFVCNTQKCYIPQNETDTPLKARSCICQFGVRYCVKKGTRKDICIKAGEDQSHLLCLHLGSWCECHYRELFLNTKTNSEFCVGHTCSFSDFA